MINADSEMVVARESFARHSIVKRSEGRWLLREPGTSVFWFEVVVLAGGSMIVHGDIQAVVFGHYSARRDATPDDTAWQMVHWMASRKRPDDHYFIEKAGIGGTADETIWAPDDDVLRAEIVELIAAARESEAAAEPDTDLRDALEDALGNVGSLTHEQVQHAVYEALDGDAESVPQGRRVSAAMIYAHAALQRLAELLDAEDVGSLTEVRHD
jgi:hypothetical protein